MRLQPRLEGAAVVFGHGRRSQEGAAQVGKGRSGRILHEFWPLAALCLLAGSRWLLEGALPETSSTRMSQGAGCAMAAGFLGAVTATRRGKWGSKTEDVTPSAGGVLGGALVLLGPILSQTIGGRHISGDSATLALALVPVVLAVLGSASGMAEGGDLPGLLWPGLTGLTGLLLLLPEPSFASWRGWTGMVALPMLVGAGGWLFGSSRSIEAAPKTSARLPSTVWGLLLAGVVFGGLAWVSGRGGEGASFSWSAAGLDGLLALLTLETLRRLGPMRWSSQFLLLPLLGLAEGLVFLRPVMDFRSWVGLGLLAIGGVYQLIRTGSEGSTVTMLRATDVVSGD